MSTLSRKEFKEQMNFLREEMHSMRADLGVQMHSMRTDFNGQMHSMQENFNGQMHSMQENFKEQIHIFNANFNEKLSGYVTFSEKLEEVRERERAERDKRLEALIQRSEINTERATRLAERAEETAQQMAQKAMESNRRMEEMVMQSGQRAEALVGQAAQKTTDGNRSYWLSTLTGSVMTIVSVIAIAIGAYYATPNIVQTAVTAFQQGQHAASVPPK